LKCIECNTPPIHNHYTASDRKYTNHIGSSSTSASLGNSFQTWSYWTPIPRTYTTPSKSTARQGNAESMHTNCPRHYLSQPVTNTHTVSTQNQQRQQICLPYQWKETQTAPEIEHQHDGPPVKGHVQNVPLPSHLGTPFTLDTPNTAASQRPPSTAQPTILTPKARLETHDNITAPQQEDSLLVYFQMQDLPKSYDPPTNPWHPLHTSSSFCPGCPSNSELLLKSIPKQKRSRLSQLKTNLECPGPYPLDMASLAHVLGI